ncbi:hypothetical protein B0H14DRAFT_2367292, partial [Mycena olivaceomarginata]
MRFALSHYAYKNDTCGWTCVNGDILKLIIAWIHCRTAPIHFSHIKKDRITDFYKRAKDIAIRASEIPRSAPTASNEHAPGPIPPLPSTAQPLNTEKITANLPNDSSNPETAPVLPREQYPASHRGRERLYEIRERNRRKLLEAPSAAVFWKEIKKLADPAPIPVSVTAESLRNVFEKRLNPPEVLPESFDSSQHRLNRLLASFITETTTDTSEEGFFSREWTEDDIACVKDHIRKHGLNSA